MANRTWMGRWICGGALVALGACASAGPRATVNSLGIAGVWEFDLAQNADIRGTVTFTGDDRFVVRCVNDLTRPDPPRLLTTRGGAVEFNGCGGNFQVRTLDDGAVVADVTWGESRPYTAQGACTEVRTYDDGSQRCVRYEDEIAYRDTSVRARIELKRVVSM